MGFEASCGLKMQELKFLESSLKSSTSMRVTARHKRCKSDSYEGIKQDKLDDSPESPHCLKLDVGQVRCHIEPKTKQSPKTEVQSSIKQEILQLEKWLQEQFVVRQALEKALGYRSSSYYSSNEKKISKPAMELIKEIAALELEVVYLEHYLLSLYRKAFDEQISSLSQSTMDERLKSPSVTKNGMLLEISRLDNSLKKENLAVQSNQLLLPQDSLTSPQREKNAIGASVKLSGSDVPHDQSLLSLHSACSTRTSHMENPDKVVQPCCCQPLSFMESATTNVISLADHLGTRISDHIPETPNMLSEDMIKCISAIYCKLGDPLINNVFSSSPRSFLSSMSAFSPQVQSNMWTPWGRKYSSSNPQLVNPFHVEGLKEFSGPYSTMVEVAWIYRDSQRLSNIDQMLQYYRSLVRRLEGVDPRKMKHEEKLAFWINIHNALVMHAFLAYGIPQNNLKRVSSLLKATCTVGGLTVSADMIQSYILGCRMPCPGQWLRILFFPRKKFKAGYDWRAYAIEHPEPLLYFALCSGIHSDAAVRVYTPKRVFQELEVAKDEYIRATFSVRRKQTILLPRIVESFTKDSGLCPVGVVEMIQQYLPETLRKTIQTCQQGKHYKNVEWVPCNFTFRYLISKELIK